ncbi:MAG TPA: PEGA domain-containing protein, partial [Thermotogota bacterium]|nr:PEGA domain-containing protein [Thermotogota bacterium]
MKTRFFLFLFLFSLIFAGMAYATCTNWIAVHYSGTDFEFSTALETVSGQFSDGEQIKLELQLTKPAYVGVVLCTPDGRRALLYPNKLARDALLSGGFSHSLFVGTCGSQPFDVAGDYTLLVFASTSVLDLFEDFEEYVQRQDAFFPWLDEQDPRWMFPSRMDASPEWLARNLSLQVVSQQAQLNVMSTPIGAKLLLDGEFVSLTPYRAVVSPGSHELTLQMDGFEDFYETVLVGSGQLVERSIVLSASRGKKVIELDSFPQGAEVRVDGKVVGKTPLEYRFDFGTHVVNFFVDGYKNFARLLTVSPSSFNEPINQALEPINFLGDPKARLTFNVVPEKAQILLDGIVQKNLTVFPNPGRHVVQVSLEGYFPYEREIDLLPQQRVELPVILVAEGG